MPWWNELKEWLSQTLEARRATDHRMMRARRFAHVISKNKDQKPNMFQRPTVLRVLNDLQLEWSHVLNTCVFLGNFGNHIFFK